MASHMMSDDLLELVASRFKVLAEPARLAILNALREGERTVTQLQDATGLGQANLSKHLQLLHAGGFVKRRKHGLFTHYAVADRAVYRLCDLMCGRLGAESTTRRRLVAIR